MHHLEPSAELQIQNTHVVEMYGRSVPTQGLSTAQPRPPHQACSAALLPLSEQRQHMLWKWGGAVLPKCYSTLSGAFPGDSATDKLISPARPTNL